jgi:GNAT superfamily N-acetyltransferase
MLIRRAQPADAEAIAAFNVAMARETEHIELDLSRTTRGVEALLAGHGAGFYLLAEIDGRTTGQLMITYEWSDWRNGTFWWIQSVYVAPPWRRHGVFRALYSEVERMARADGGVCGIRLYVESENKPAREVYQRLGMRPTPYQVFEVDFVIRRTS